jgi:L-iditol 2-dehydrogenase
VLSERPASEPGAGEVAVEVRATGICGTDVSIYSGKIPVRHPLIMGHEMAGRVLAAGDGVALEPGTRVVVDPNVHCGDCYQCRKGQANVCTKGALMGRDRDGAFRDAVIVPAANVHPLPDGIEDGTAPVIQVLTTCVHGHRTTPIFPGDSVLVIGLGVTGLLHAQIARARGASRVIGVTRSAFKRETAAQLGADVVVDADDPHWQEEVRAATSERGPDVVIEAAGQVETLTDAIACVRVGGHIMLFGTITAAEGALPYYQLYYREITLTNPRAAKPEDFPAAIDLVAGGAVRIDPLVTDTVGLERAADAIEMTRSPSTLKVVLDHKDGSS